MNDRIKVTSSFEILCNCINAENTKLKFSVLIRFKVLDWSHIRKHIGLLKITSQRKHIYL